MGPTGQEFTPDEWTAICLANWLATTEDQVYFKDRASRFVRVSTHVVEAMRAGRGELRGLAIETENDLIGRTDHDLFVDATADVALESEAEIVRTGVAAPEVVERQTWPDGSFTYVATSKFPLRDAGEAIVGTFGFSRDVTDDVAVRRQLSDVLSFSPDAISRLDTQLRHLFVNPAAVATMGLDAADIIGRTHAELGIVAEYGEVWVTALRRVVATGEPARLEHTDGEGDDAHFYESHLVAESDVDTVTGVLIFTRDITERKRAELALADQAVRDPLTGLANRALLLDRLDQALQRLDRLPGIVAVLFLDLDKFKPINDTFGHAAGDSLLKQVADRLRGCARRTDTLARFGGDEFVILCERLAVPEDARTAAERVIRELDRPFVVDGNTVRVTASVGVAVASDPNTPAAGLIRDADVAMYQAKERGRGGGRYQFFDPELRQSAINRFQIENELRTALTDNQFRLYYQPLHNLSTGELHGVEALVRWQHPTRGLLGPPEFLAVAEQCDVIVALGEWVLNEGCSQLAHWNSRRAGAPLTMAVNVSARQLASHSLVDAVATALRTHGIPPHLLCLEITETALLEEATSSPDMFAKLRALGVRLALDNFGSGYSSLAHLRRFPVDIIKINQEFVRELSPGGGDLVIAAAITAMAHALGMVTVGEGVETAAQLSQLREIGCDDGQGYLLARPMPAAELDALLTDPQP